MLFLTVMRKQSVQQDVRKREGEPLPFCVVVEVDPSDSCKKSYVSFLLALTPIRINYERSNFISA